MHWWSVVPGFALIMAGFVIQFGTHVRRPRDARLVLTGVRLRFMGLGVFHLLIGVDFALSALFAGFEIGMLVVGLVFIGFALLWFYAATDRIFRISSGKE